MGHGTGVGYKSPSFPPQRKLLKAARKAGWIITDTTNGWIVKSPDGKGMVTMHTSSNPSAIKNMYADFRRAGLELS